LAAAIGAAQVRRPMSEFEKAIKQLMRSDRGLETLGDVADWMFESGSYLDSANQDAIMRLIIGCWGGKCGEALDCLRPFLTEKKL